MVLDQSSNEPIPYATISIYNDSLLIGGTSSSEKGKFTLNELAKFTHLEISFVGYQTLTIPFQEIDFDGVIEFRLPVSVDVMEDLIVETDRHKVEMLFDRKVIKLGADLQQDGVTGLEAIDQIPEIQADLSTGVLSLRGSEQVRLLINGKPSGQNASELLSQISSSEISKIEIITTPSAKELADGLSGIINIVLKKNSTEGLNLKATSGVGTKRHAYGIESNYNLSLLNLRLSASRSSRKMDSKQTLNRLYRNSETEGIFTPHQFDGNVNRFVSGLDLYLDDHNVFSLGFDYTKDEHDFYNNSIYSGTRGGDYEYLRISKHTHLISNINGNYRHDFQQNNHFLEVDYNRNINDNFFPTVDRISNSVILEENYDYENVLQAFSFDYSLPLKEQTILEAGFSWNQRSLTSAFAFRDSDQAFNNVFNYQEDVLGSYIMLKSRLRQENGRQGQMLNWQVGLRIEQFLSNSENFLTKENIARDFLNAFPSIHLTYHHNESQRLTLGYSRRVSRPNFRHINPFQLGNPYFRFVGNPFLNPEFSDNLDLGYQYAFGKLDFSASAFYRLRKNVIQNIQDVEEGVEVITYKNAGENSSLGVEVNSAIEITSAWDVSFAGNYYHTKINDVENITWDQLNASNIQLRNTVKLNSQFILDLTYRHTPRRQNAFSYIFSRNRIDWAMRFKTKDNRLSLNLRVIDVLNRNLMERRTITTGFEQDEVWRFQSQTRGYLLNISYKISDNKIRNRNKKERNYEHEGTKED